RRRGRCAPSHHSRERALSLAIRVLRCLTRARSARCTASAFGNGRRKWDGAHSFPRAGGSLAAAPELAGVELARAWLHGQVAGLSSHGAGGPRLTEYAPTLSTAAFGQVQRGTPIATLSPLRAASA